jgi:hypothetical protein
MNAFTSYIPEEKYSQYKDVDADTRPDESYRV